MPLVIMLGVAVQYILKYAVTKIMLVLGLGFVTYTGIGSLVDNLETALLNHYGSMSADVWNMATLCGLDVSLTILVSALALSLQIKGMVAGAKILSNIGR